jgi:hypothetical protein
MKQDVVLTPGGGRYYKALTYHWAVTIAALPLITVILFTAILNPLWCRTDFFNYIEKKINQFSAWRNKTKYRIYLGTDPDVWHALKD